MPQPYIVGDSSPFLKRVLIPFWVVRIIIMLFLIGIYALFLGAVGAWTNDSDFRGTGVSRSTVLAVFAVVMVLILICLILDIVCIVKRSRRTLSPRFFLIVSVIQTTFWLVDTILGALGGATGLGIAISVLILLSFLGLMIYAAVVFHQFRTGKLTGGNYAPAYNPALAPGGGAAVVGAAPMPYAANTPYGNTEYASTGYSQEAQKPVQQYGEVPMPTHQGYGQQASYGVPQPQQTYGYEMSTRQ